MFWLATMLNSLKKPVKKLNNTKFGDFHEKKQMPRLRLQEIQVL